MQRFSSEMESFCGVRQGITAARQVFGCHNGEALQLRKLFAKKELSCFWVHDMLSRLAK
jgi:hypothetical protein